MFDLFGTDQKEHRATPAGDAQASSLISEAEALVQSTAGDLIALGSLLMKLPGAVRDAAVEASHRLLGSQATGQAITLACEPTAAPQLASMPQAKATELVCKMPPTAATAAPKPSEPVAATHITKGLERFKSKEATLAGDTLDIAKTRVDLGVDKTAYNRTYASKKEESQAAADLASGSDKTDTFYCSGLSIWTLAAAGFDMSKRLQGSDGKDIYGETTREAIVDADGREVTTKQQKPVGKGMVIDRHYVKFKQILDGEPQAVEIMTLAEQKLGGKGGSVGAITGANYQVKDDVDELPLAARGAAGAFTLAHVGREVPPADQKPGDFAQSRRRTKGADDKGTEAQRGHYGGGHAWQVWATHVKGAALFGRPGSPTPKSGKLEGWHEGVEFTIAHDTDPATIGEHVVTGAERLEANWAKSIEASAKDKNGNQVGDGGVQITSEKSTKGEAAATDDTDGVFYGRLATSPWANWEPAQPPATK